MDLRILATGGTFDKRYDPITGALGFGDTHLHEIVARARLSGLAQVEVVMMIDSLDMVDQHRLQVLAACRAAPEPALVVVCPATAQDCYSLLKSAVASGDPVAYFEHKELWALEGEVDTSQTVELGRARIARPGRDLTIVSWGRALHESLEAARTLAGQGIDAEVIDLRTIWPWDRETVEASARRTGRVLVVHEAVQVAGFGAEIVATLAEHTDAKLARLGAPRSPVGYAPTLEAQTRVTAAKIAAAATRLAASAG